MSDELFTSFLGVARSPVTRNEPAPRIGLTVSRKVGNAVVRNRLKRQIREWFRQSDANLGEGGELVVIARSQAGRSTRRQVRAALHRLGERLGETARGALR